MRQRTFGLLLVVALSVAAPAAASRTPLPDAQATPTARMWLSRAMVAEAGWYAKRDHIGIAYVLARRWRQVVRRLPHLRFVDIIRLYCTALRPRRRQPSARQRWLLALHGPERPAGWPSHKADWDVYRPRWRATYERAGDFLEGRLRDPCKGKAMHWGGDMDLELADKKGLVPVDCGDTRNTFLGLPKKEASELDAGAKKPEA